MSSLHLPLRWTGGDNVRRSGPAIRNAADSGDGIQNDKSHDPHRHIWAERIYWIPSASLQSQPPTRECQAWRTMSPPRSSSPHPAGKFSPRSCSRLAIACDLTSTKSRDEPRWRSPAFWPWPDSCVALGRQSISWLDPSSITNSNSHVSLHQVQLIMSGLVSPKSLARHTSQRAQSRLTDGNPSPRAAWPLGPLQEQIARI
ncbi:hypothetical protein B0T14DRAFT_280937 [Immersiella caudata]|uniref:Uncharacterized protein n=1 Tax=Immersiella caudata TaxID=314043 RepID=A0AA39WDQ6_9PEZI|nr:hypothetical protein B0T14DRAFT_280937 [Immersiella caudata]